MAPSSGPRTDRVRRIQWTQAFLKIWPWLKSAIRSTGWTALQTDSDRRGDFGHAQSRSSGCHASRAGHGRRSNRPRDRRPADRAERPPSPTRIQRPIRTRSGATLFELHPGGPPGARRILSDPQDLQAIRAGIEATWWLIDHLQAWLGEVNTADALTQPAPNNVTSEMGLALLDVADLIRPHPEVVALLERQRGGRLPRRVVNARRRAEGPRRYSGLP